MTDGWKLILGVLLVLAAIGKSHVPNVDPKPVDPKPPVVVVEPDTAPFKSEQLSVLIVEDSASRRDLPSSQVNIFTSARLRKHFTDIGADVRFWTISEDGSQDTAVFQQAAKVPRDSVPWIAIAHGRKGFSGPLPTTVDGVIALVDQYK